MVRNDQRFTPANPCPVCNGHQRMRQGQGVRCWGFQSDQYVYCTRDEYAGYLNGNSRTDAGYRHYMADTCYCGKSHGGWMAPPIPIISQRTRDEDRDAELYAASIWAEGRSIIRTPAGEYLRSRGIEAPDDLWLRWHPHLYHKDSGQYFGALLAAVTTEGSDQVHAIQRIYLEGNRKAEVVPNKATLGRIRKGAVRLVSAQQKLGLAEGIETALSVTQGVGVACWAVLGDKLNNTQIPPIVKELELYADGDDAGTRAAEVAAPEYIDQGLAVSVVQAPDGYDWNDVLMGVAS